MAYTPPTRASSKRSRSRRLTIGNTDKYKNYNSITTDDVNSMIRINRVNIKQTKKALEKKLNKGVIDNHIYIYSEGLPNKSEDIEESDIIDLLDMGVDFVYHPHQREVSDSMLDALSKGLGNTSVLYSYKANYMHSIEAVREAHEATRVVFDVPLVIPDMTQQQIISAFEPYKTSIDEVQLDICPLTQEEIDYGKGTEKGFMAQFRKTKYYLRPDGKWYSYPKTKYDVFKSVEKAFSSWGTYITMICTDKQDKSELDKLVKEGNK